MDAVLAQRMRAMIRNLLTCRLQARVHQDGAFLVHAGLQSGLFRYSILRALLRSHIESKNPGPVSSVKNSWLSD